MSEFTPITTQEELDALIADRLKRKDEQVAKKYGDYDALKERATTYEEKVKEMTKQLEELTSKSQTYDKTVSDLEAKVKGYETADLKRRIATEKGLPAELADRLTGATEEDLGKDAEKLLAIVGQPKKKAAPLGNPELDGGNPADAMWRGMAKSLSGKGE